MIGDNDLPSPLLFPLLLLHLSRLLHDLLWNLDNY